MRLEQHNAKITHTQLGYEDHGILTFYLFLEWGSNAVGFGGYALDEWSPTQNKRVGTAIGLDCLKELMHVVGVEKWEDLKGQHVVVEGEGLGGRGATGIRNLLDENKWFRPKEWFESKGYK